MLNDVRYAIRNLRGPRGVGICAILALAMGLAAATVMFSVVDAAIFRQVPFADADRLVMLYNTRFTARDGLARLRWSRPHIVALQQSARSFEAVASFSSVSLAVGDDEPEQIDGEVVSPDYFRTLRISPLAGRSFEAADDAPGAPPTVLISERLWRLRLDSDRLRLGKTLRVNDVPLTLVGILPAGFAGLSGKARAWILPSMAARLTYSDYLTTPQHFISVVARLKPGVGLSQANAELASIGTRFSNPGSDSTAAWSAAAVPINEARVESTVRRSAILLFAAAAGLLLIACLNVACVLLARARTRRREIAMRLALGASRPRIVRQLLTEGLVTAAIACAAGWGLSAWGVVAFARTAPGIIPTSRNDYGALAAFAVPQLDLSALAFAIGISAASTVLFALAPALEASRPQVTTAIKEADGPGRARTLGLLVATEVALAVTLLVTAGVLVDGFAAIQQRRTGFDPDGIVTFWVRPPNSRYQPAAGPAILERLLTRIQRVPGVERAALNRCTPFTGCSRTTIFFPDRAADPTTAPVVGRHYVSGDYFRTLGIPLKAGRAIADSDRAGTAPVAVANETAARRFWPGENPIGRRLWFGSATGFTDPSHPVEVVGVVGDVKYEGPDQPVGPDFYTSYLQFAYPDSMVIVKTRVAGSALFPALRTAVASVDRSVPLFDAMPLDDRIDAAVARPRFNASLLTAFAGSALLLAALGVYGVESYAVAARTREIGVRLALGADGWRVIGLVLREAYRFVIGGAAAGVASALAVSRLLQGLLTGAGPWRARVLVLSLLAIAVAASVAALIPARRASTVDPLVALRTE